MEYLTDFKQRDFRKAKLELIKRCEVIMDKHRKLMEEIRRELSEVSQMWHIRQQAKI